MKKLLRDIFVLTAGTCVLWLHPTLPWMVAVTLTIAIVRGDVPAWKISILMRLFRARGFADLMQATSLTFEMQNGERAIRRSIYKDDQGRSWAEITELCRRYN